MELEIKGGRIIFDAQDEGIVRGHKWFINNRGYAAVYIKGRYWLLHRYLLGLGHGDGRCVDHINRIKHDNRRVNLRVCTFAENLKNKPNYKNNKLGFKGVDHRHGSRYRARIKVNGKIKILGTFPTAEEAARAFDRAALIYVGPHAHLNFPEGRILDFGDPNSTDEKAG